MAIGCVGTGCRIDLAAARYPLGYPGCENRLAYLAHEAGYPGEMLAFAPWRRTMMVLEGPRRRWSRLFSEFVG